MGLRSLHIVRSSDRFGWKTGRDSGDVRMLAGVLDGGLGLRIRFDDRGQMASFEREDLGASPDPAWAATGLSVEKPIRVREFDLADLPVGLRALPYEYVAFADHAWDFDPTERSRFAVQINEWKERHRYVFHWGLEFWCDEEGQVTGWRPRVVGEGAGR
jgi:hypothetical protein